MDTKKPPKKIPKPLSKRLRDSVLETIRATFPDGGTELVFETPFQCMIAVILSAQTTDRQVNRVTPALFARVCTPADLLRIPPDEVETLLRSVNHYRNKTKFIIGCAAKLVTEYAGIIPNDLTVLQTLP